MGGKFRIIDVPEDPFFRAEMELYIIHRSLDRDLKILPGRLVSLKAALIKGISQPDEFFMLIVYQGDTD
jgi:hypothetical protein